MKGRPRLLDLFCGEGGAAVGYYRAGFDVVGVDTDAARLKRYPFPHVLADALEYGLKHGAEFDVIHASPTCTGYSRATAALPDRLDRYDRLIAASRDVLEQAGRPYVIENVADARPELHAPILLCGRSFGLAATDDDGTRLVMDRHRLFESPVFLMQPAHPPHRRALQVAGSYAGARRDKLQARHVRHGGYVPSADVQRALLGVPWMSERGAMLSIPPVYTEWIGAQLLDALHLEGTCLPARG
jgi:DNA (cytosine-5)-methyltransferase 1